MPRSAHSLPSERVVILGAGPCGLACVDELKRLGHPAWTLLEAASVPGGLGSSVVDPAGFTWGLGGHVVFSHFGEFDRLLAELFTAGELLHHDRSSYIRFRDRWVPCPFQQHLHHLPAEDAEACVHDLLLACRRREQQLPAHADFATWLQGMYGSGLVERFFGPYNSKVWARWLPPGLPSASLRPMPVRSWRPWREPPGPPGGEAPTPPSPFPPAAASERSGAGRPLASTPVCGPAPAWSPSTRRPAPRRSPGANTSASTTWWPPARLLPGGHVLLRVCEAELIGVRGTLYSRPGRPGPADDGALVLRRSRMSGSSSPARPCASCATSVWSPSRRPRLDRLPGDSETPERVAGQAPDSVPAQTLRCRRCRRTAVPARQG
ncbi:NAD(P)-binding protein [Streptomyces griseoincarnatus]